ncbi:fructokinase [Tamaricihabitans halophyticus]|uniref:Fructokinase n=1 Tax=Tamaricihabitans halophyticus TaxID=1262583 RepID=A0A4V2SV23_9PSEU|nr:carbohydrate kinase [Tamaricihabitans halophyticus]TCP56526.1 fructokinase [Tamaricihabitans halophyticus]
MIVVGGEALVDLVPSAVDDPLSPLAPKLGGGPYNVAIAAARLDVPVSFLSRVSTDPFGRSLMRRLDESRVDLSLVERGSEPTTLAVVALDGSGSAHYTFYTEGTADRLFVDPGSLPSETTMLSLGTLGMVLEPGATAYEAVLARAAGAGVLTALDPNIRADLIADQDAYRARFRRWLPHTSLLKLSDADAAWLADQEDDVERAVRDWLTLGPSAVVLTRGADGLAVFTAAGGTVHVPAVRVPVVDTIGAGDTIQAALLAWLHRKGLTGPGQLAELADADWRSALDFAAAAAAVTVSREGAQPPVSGEVTEMRSGV